MKEFLSDTVKHIMDGLTIGGVFGYVFDLFTMPRAITFLTLIWAFSRAYRELTGEELYLLIRRWRQK